MPAAIHKVGERGMTSSASEASTAPARKYGRRLPEPVPGAIGHVADDRLHQQAGERRRDPQAPAISSTSAPSVWKIRLTLAFCSPKANWIPRNPKHMFQICQNDTCGRAARGRRDRAHSRRSLRLPLALAKRIACPPPGASRSVSVSPRDTGAGFDLDGGRIAGKARVLAVAVDSRAVAAARHRGNRASRRSVRGCSSVMAPRYQSSLLRSLRAMVT